MSDKKQELNNAAQEQVSGGKTDSGDVLHAVYMQIWCPNCGKSFRNDQVYREVTDPNTGEIYYQCPYCGKLSKSGIQL